MKSRLKLTHLITMTLCSLTLSLHAESLDQKVQRLEKRLKTLEEQSIENTESLTAAMVNLKEKVDLPQQVYQSFSGMGLAASKVYFSKEKLSIGGYGEIVYQDIQGATGDTTDTLRLVPYIGYRFNDWIIFNSEIEFEHGGSTVAVEFAYVDFLIDESFGVRVGNVLVPMGITNLLHEPTLFPSVNRSEVERNILPSTWHENGILLHGEWKDFAYHLGTVNGLDGSDFSSSSWIRSGRQKGNQAKAQHWAAVARLDYNGLKGLSFGGSFFSGKSAQDNVALDDATVIVWDLHLLYQWKALKLKALFVEGTLEDAAKVSTANAVTVGEKAQGFYIEAEYDFLPLINPTSQQSVSFFSRYEDYDTQKEVASGFTKDNSLDRQRLLVGFNYKPVPNMAAKANYVFRDNKSGNEDDLVELGLGFVF